MLLKCDLLNQTNVGLKRSSWVGVASVQGLCQWEERDASLDPLTCTPRLKPQLGLLNLGAVDRWVRQVFVGSDKSFCACVMFRGFPGLSALDVTSTHPLPLAVMTIMSPDIANRPLEGNDPC